MILAVAGGGAVGSIARYIAAIYIGRAAGTGFPWATLVINITGSFLIGALAEAFALRWQVSQEMRAFLVVGICGGYTTFSTFSLDVMLQIERGAALGATAYIVGSVALSVGALYAALHIMRWLLV